MCSRRLRVSGLLRAVVFHVLITRYAVDAIIEAQDELFSKLTNASIYNKRVRPGYAIGIPVIVNTTIFLQSMAATNDLHTEYTAQLVVQQTWVDQRLFYNGSTLPDSRIQGDHWHAERIWLPSVQLTNTKTYDTNSLLQPGSTLILVFPDGTVIFNRRMHLQLQCQMEFHKYPMDKQKCSLKMESSTLSTQNMLLLWKSGKPLVFSDNFDVKGFQMLGYNYSSSITEDDITGNFSSIRADFDLKRDFAPFLLEIYIPSTTFVITSWFSLWIDIPAAPARVTLAMTTFLTLVTGGKSIREKLPKVPYVHALDVWYLACTGFVFFILLEYAMVNYIYHKDNRRRQGGIRRIDSTASLGSLTSKSSTSLYNIMAAYEQQQINNNQLPKPPSSPSYLQTKFKKNGRTTPVLKLSDLEAGLSSVNETPLTPPLSRRASLDTQENFVCTVITPLTPRDIANGIDRHCRYLFPLTFLLFNGIYWSVLKSF
ncbi:glutamate-gated chloride channel alpha-like [Ornithodoros turicata]|uniref:glutamate-gated chloride channel alpha-like n=1 Tax=Ornithodoros turicata TaxID=34597 RepID=UPI003138CCFF